MFDSGYAPHDAGLARAWWMDDDRLLFVGLDRPNPVDMKDRRSALLIWELGKKPTIYKPAVDTLICYREGRLIYFLRDRDSKTRTVYFGPIDRENALTGAFFWDSINCEPQDAATVKGRERSIQSLRYDHGYLDFGLKKQPLKERTVSFHPRDASPVQLPFNANQFSNLAFDYYGFRGAYFLPISRARKPGEEGLPSPIVDVAYWMWPNGKLEKMDMPAEISEMYPTRAGFVYRLFGTKTGDGLYLMNAKRDRQRLVKGSITQLSVSPNGCKVAFRYAATHEAALWKPNKPASSTLRVASVCN